MPQILRDNVGDARVVDDVAALAAAYDDDAVATAATTARQRRDEDLALLRELFARTGEPAAPLPRRVATHIARHRTYYIVAALVLGVLLFRSPEPLPLAAGEDDASHLIPTVDAEQSTATPATDAAEQFDLPESVTLPFDSPSDFAALTPFVAPTPDAATQVAAPPVLRFSQTGYSSSALAGTALQPDPPANGIPVEAVAGTVTQYSYARLTGGGTVLRLKQLTGGDTSLNADLARVQLCHITTANWKPSRGGSDGPKYSENQCLAGTNKNGIWTFTFSALFNPLDANGWAIVPYLDGNQTFRVTFSTTAVV